VSPLPDWRDSQHWAQTPKPCRFCRKPTHIRDDYGRPTHKVCAEAHPEQTARPPRGQAR
jgi:hypothetical protein